jgi:predicted metal-dependent HD superfamily phosphohydrolase
MNVPVVEAAMRERWWADIRPFAPAPETAEACFAELVAHYSAADRHYHNLRHISNVLQVIDTLAELHDEQTAVALAAWFHDVVYDLPAVAGPSNEERSANYAGHALADFGVPADTIASVQQLIRATQLGTSPPDRPACHVLLDADLATLAADTDIYDQYAQAIRQEYSFVPEAAYRLGRSQVLAGFLARERIFLTPPMYEQYEPAARRNIQREIDSLAPSVEESVS